MAAADRARPEHVLVLAPMGRDAALCCAVLRRAGIDARPCKDFAALTAGIAAGAGAAVVVEEALAGGRLDELRRALAMQEPWSDFPVIVFAALASSRRRPRPAFGALGNVTLLDRPTGTGFLVSAVEAALRGRRRQYDALEARRRDEVELRHASEFQQRLIGISGHDLRNPLSAITMAASLLAEPNVSDDRRIRLAARIASSAQRMERIVADLGDYSRARVGAQLPLFPRPCDFHRICDDVLDELRGTNPTRTLVYDPEGDATGTWDADRLKQALSNLITNAIKYGSPDDPITLRWKREPRAGSYEDDLVVEVANQGPPIDPSLLGEIFEPFRLGVEMTASGKNSLGLGLFITREIVRAHGGDLAVTSDGANGTKFTFRVPGAVTRR